MWEERCGRAARLMIRVHPWKHKRTWNALALAREARARRTDGIMLAALSSLLNDTGKTAQAERGHGEAFAIHREGGRCIL